MSDIDPTLVDDLVREAMRGYDQLIADETDPTGRMLMILHRAKAERAARASIERNLAVAIAAHEKVMREMGYDSLPSGYAPGDDTVVH
jgi:hypothetical protein